MYTTDTHSSFNPYPVGRIYDFMGEAYLRVPQGFSKQLNKMENII